MSERKQEVEQQTERDSKGNIMSMFVHVSYELLGVFRFKKCALKKAQSVTENTISQCTV